MGRRSNRALFMLLSACVSIAGADWRNRTHARQEEQKGFSNVPLSQRMPKDVADLPSFGMHEGVEEVEVDGEKRHRAYGCVMGRVWREYGGDELGRIYCYVDPASSMEFDPRCKFVHTKAIPDGDDFCELVMRQTTQRDREDYASPDTDWAAIETRTE